MNIEKNLALKSKTEQFTFKTILLKNASIFLFFVEHEQRELLRQKETPRNCEIPISKLNRKQVELPPNY